MVLEIQDTTGGHWIVKRPNALKQYQQERHAYEQWLEPLRDYVPQLVAADDEAQAMIISLLPGEVDRAAHPECHRAAGMLIRQLHAAGSRRDDGYAARLAAKLDECSDRLDALAAGDKRLLRDQVQWLSDEVTYYVPTHGDNQPRNWLVDDAGVVRIIDFGLARWDVTERDLLRLYLRYGDRSEFWDAYRAGYADERPLDTRRLAIAAAIGALTTVVWAVEHDDSAFAGMAWRGYARALDVLRERRR